MNMLTTRRGAIAAIAALALAALAPAHASGFESGRISVRTEGSGPDVILIPGMNSSPRVWAELVKALPGYRYHLVHVHGFAGKPAGANCSGPVSAPVAEEVHRYIQSEKLGKPAVIGHSMGGTIGMMLAARNPASISKLMVVDQLPFLGMLFGPPGTTAETVRPAADAVLAQSRTATPETRKANAQSFVNVMIMNAAMRPAALEDSLASDQDVGSRSYHEMIVTDLRPELARISVPVSVVYALPKGNPMSPVLAMAYPLSYTGIKGAKLIVIDDSSHFIMWDQPKKFQDEVRQFLRKD
jgi:pimeloyl-ACP methyl ester carboxylesterase